MGGDIKRLRESYPNSRHYDEVTNLQEIHQSRGDIGLDSLCQEILGSRLNKRMQRSDWEERPLSDEQVEYAALDAVVLLEIWHKLS